MAAIIKQAHKGTQQWGDNYSGLPQFHQALLEEETLSGMVDVLHKLFIAMVEQSDQQEEHLRNDMLIETIKEMIETNYHDMGMSLQSIADHLGMSNQYIGRQFKKKIGMSVAEYMNEIRLEHSLPLLNNENFTIKEVMERVGIGNESHYFRMFKKKLGKTPREYRLQNRMKD